MLPRSVHPELLRGFRFSDHHHCHLALLHDPGQPSAATIVLEIHVVVPEDAIHDLENPGPGRLSLLTVLSRDQGFAEVLRHGFPAPLDAEGLAVLRNL